MCESAKFKVRQVKGGLLQPSIVIEKVLTEAQLKELGFWSEKLEKEGYDYWGGDNKVTYVRALSEGEA